MKRVRCGMTHGAPTRNTVTKCVACFASSVPLFFRAAGYAYFQFVGDYIAHAGVVFHHDLTAPALGQTLCQHAREDADARAAATGHNDANRPGGLAFLCACVQSDIAKRGAGKKTGDTRYHGFAAGLISPSSDKNARSCA